MPESLSELAQKYRDEMLRMYRTKPPRPKPPCPAPPPPSRPNQNQNPPPPPPRPNPNQNPPPPPPPRPNPNQNPPPPPPPRPNQNQNPPPPPPPRPNPNQNPPPPFSFNSGIIPANAQPEIPPPILEIEPDSVIKTEITEKLPEIQENPESLESSEIPEMNPESSIHSNPETALPSEPELEEPVLPDYIQPAVPSLPDEWTSQEAYEKHNSAEGMLYVVASTADSAYPVPNARVIISSEIDGRLNLNYILLTDESGITPTVTLPAPPASLSQTPENAKPYAVYNILIYAAGYFREQAREVPVFAGITSRQVFPMIPLPLAVDENDETLQISPQDATIS